MVNKNNLLDEFIQIINSIYGVYLDSTLGFKLLNEYIQKMQKKSLLLIGKDATIEKLDMAEFIYGIGFPPKQKNFRDPGLLHITTQGELKERNKEGGENFIVAGNICMVQIYQYWEDKYREEIARTMSLTKNQLTSDIFGELRHIRVCVIHNNGIATTELEKKVKIVRFRKGELIFIRPNNIREIISTIKEYLYSLYDAG